MVWIGNGRQWGGGQSGEDNVRKGKEGRSLQGLVASLRGAKEVREGLGLLDSLHGAFGVCPHTRQSAFAAKAIFSLTFRACVHGVAT